MSNHFLHTLQELRACEELVLYDRLAVGSPGHAAEANAWLAAEWKEEALAWPGTPPPFDAAAARWGARTTYLAAQLLLNRAHTAGEAATLLQPYAGRIDAGALLSADLLLRFLPDLLRQLVLMDPEDPLRAPLEAELTRFHYSAVGYAVPIDNLDWSAVTANDCLLHLYTERVIGAGALALGRQPALRTGINAALGLHAAVLWPAWQKENT